MNICSEYLLATFRWPRRLPQQKRDQRRIAALMEAAAAILAESRYGMAARGKKDADILRAC